MPTVLRVGGFRFLILLPPREHGPPHVHVFRAGTSVVIELATLTIRDARGMSDPDIRNAAGIVEEHAATLLDEWRKIHGA